MALIVINASQISTNVYLKHPSFVRWLTSQFLPLSIYWCTKSKNSSLLECSIKESRTLFGKIFSVLWHFTLEIHLKCPCAYFSSVAHTQNSCQSSVENSIKVLMAKAKSAKTWLCCLLVRGFFIPQTYLTIRMTVTPPAAEEIRLLVRSKFLRYSSSSHYLLCLLVCVFCLETSCPDKSLLQGITVPILFAKAVPPSLYIYFSSCP